MKTNGETNDDREEEQQEELEEQEEHEEHEEEEEDWETLDVESQLLGSLKGEQNSKENSKGNSKGSSEQRESASEDGDTESAEVLYPTHNSSSKIESSNSKTSSATQSPTHLCSPHSMRKEVVGTMEAKSHKYGVELDSQVKGKLDHVCELYGFPSFQDSSSSMPRTQVASILNEYLKEKRGSQLEESIFVDWVDENTAIIAFPNRRVALDAIEEVPREYASIKLRLIDDPQVSLNTLKRIKEIRIPAPIRGKSDSAAAQRMIARSLGMKLPEHLLRSSAKSRDSEKATASATSKARSQVSQREDAWD